MFTWKRGCGELEKRSLPKQNWKQENESRRIEFFANYPMNIRTIILNQNL